MTNDEQSIRRRVDKITDGLGLPIDPHIKELVVALNVHHVPTSQSCEGHLDHGYPYPWVEIYLDEPEDWQNNDQVKQKWLASHRALQARIVKLLTDYYQHYSTPYDAIFSLTPIGIYGAFRLEPIGGPLISTLPPTQQSKILYHYQSQANHLAHYLLTCQRD